MNAQTFLTGGVSMAAALFLFPAFAAAAVDVHVGPFHVNVGNRPSADPVEVLARGPIHEAFAEPVALNPESELVISRQPPPPIVETIPAERPEGQNVFWVPGYWAWDDDRSDFIWVSGCWRTAPPGRSWVPGYWAATDRGYLWVPGFWADANTEEIEYLPPVPQSLEQGPVVAQPSPDSVWVPGAWRWTGDRYAWRPGYWMQARADWVWVPEHYVCSQRGCVFVDGYWDYPMEARGVLFSPVYIAQDAYYQPGFRYQPDIVVNVVTLYDMLFARPDYGHYYFGDYYEDRYNGLGYYPWVDAREYHQWYDPIFSYLLWRHHDDRDWTDRLRRDYDYRREHKDARPRHTYRDWSEQYARSKDQDKRDRLLAPLADAARDQTRRFERVDPAARSEFSRRAEQTRQYQSDRTRWEARGGRGVTAPTTPATPREPTPPAGTIAPKATTPPAPAAPMTTPKAATPASPAPPATPRETAPKVTPATPATPGSPAPRPSIPPSWPPKATPASPAIPATPPAKPPAATPRDVAPSRDRAISPAEPKEKLGPPPVAVMPREYQPPEPKTAPPERIKVPKSPIAGNREAAPPPPAPKPPKEENPPPKPERPLRSP